jgi:hypothetical protein
MKILMTVTLAMLVSASVFGACTVGTTCSEADCKALGTGYALNPANLCTKVGSSETDGICPAIDGSARVVAPTQKVDAKDKPKDSQNSNHSN